MMDTDRPLTHLSLFSGIGGLDLAAEWAGFQTVGQCEFADYPTKVLEKHWPDVPRWRDIRTLTKESFYERTGRRTVDVISGGFPCQPFSTAGKRRGKEDDRYLWPEMCRVIQELRPSWVVGENVVGLISMALDQAISDLESSGYTCRTVVFPACAVGAPHRRDRCAILAHTDSNGRKGTGPELPEKCDADTFNPSFAESCDAFGKHWAAEPGVGRVAHGISHRVDRLKCLGNAVVPQQFYPIFRAIADVERSMRNGDK